MSKFLLANILLQWIGGLSLLIYPQLLLLGNYEMITVHLVRFLGIQAVFIGFFLFIWYHFKNKNSNKMYQYCITLYHFVAGVFMLFLYLNHHSIILAASITHWMMFILWLIFLPVIKPHGNQNH